MFLVAELIVANAPALVSQRIVGVVGNGLVKVGDGFLVLAAAGAYHPESVVGFGVVGFDGDGVAVIREGTVVIPQVFLGQAAVVEDFRVVRGQTESAVKSDMARS